MIIIATLLTDLVSSISDFFKKYMESDAKLDGQQPKKNFTFYF